MVDLTEGRPKRKVKMMQFSQFVAGEESDTKPLQNKESTGPAKEKDDKAEPPTGFLRGKRMGHKKKKVMKDNALRSSGGSDEDLASLSLCRFYNTVPNNLPLGYSSLHHLMANVDKECLADICKALNLCPDGTFEMYDAGSSIPPAAMMPWGNRFFLF